MKASLLFPVWAAGNRFYPEKLMIADINKSHTCPLARVMRRELKKRGIKKQLVLFSTEKPTKPQFRGEAQAWYM